MSVSKCVSCFVNWFFHQLMMLFPIFDFVATLVICSVKLHSPVFAHSGFSTEGFLIIFGWISALGTLMGLCVSGNFPGMYRRAGPFCADLFWLYLLIIRIIWCDWLKGTLNQASFGRTINSLFWENEQLSFNHLGFSLDKNFECINLFFCHSNSQKKFYLLILLVAF